MTTDSGLTDVFTRLVRVQTDLWNVVDARIRADHGVPLTDLTALQVVVATPACRVHDLVTTLHITVGGASKVVDRLVAAGYATRTPNPDDRRSSILAPTMAGQTLVTAARPSIEAVLRERLGSRLTTHELINLTTALRKMQGTSHLSLEEGA
jgi:DNA-binding MarR family transcriptional regulator